jgi:hypothetical protein
MHSSNFWVILLLVASSFSGIFTVRKSYYPVHLHTLYTSSFCSSHTNLHCFIWAVSHPSSLHPQATTFYPELYLLLAEVSVVALENIFPLLCYSCACCPLWRLGYSLKLNLILSLSVCRYFQWHPVAHRTEIEVSPQPLPWLARPASPLPGLSPSLWASDWPPTCLWIPGTLCYRTFLLCHCPSTPPLPVSVVFSSVLMTRLCHLHGTAPIISGQLHSLAVCFIC